MKMSKKLLVVLPVSLLLLAGCGGDKADTTKDSDAKTETKAEVKPFVSKEGNFSIVFPGEPEVASEPLDLDDGTTLNMATFSYEISDDDVVMLAYSDVPVKNMDEKAAKEFLKNEMSGALGAFDIEKPELQKEVSLDGNPGMTYRAKSEDGIYIIAQTYLVKNRLYQIEMLSQKEYPADEKVQEFIGSFKLLK